MVDRDEFGGLDERLRSGDDAALAEAFSLAQPRLRKMVAFRMDHRLAGRLDPDDVLQEAYLEAAQRLPHYLAKPGDGLAQPGDGSAQQAEGTPGERLYVWLRLITAQTLVDAHRRHLGAQMRDATREQGLWQASNAVATSVSLAGVLIGRLTSPSNAALRDEAAAELRRAIASLSEVDQEVIALRHFEELTNGEVARVLGIEVKAASIRYVRAVKRLKELLDHSPVFAQSGGRLLP